MEQVLTLVCKLQPTDEQAQHLDATLTRFADACTYIHTTLSANIRNKDRMQAMLYYDVRSRFQLSANLAIQAIRRVAMNRKAAHETGSAVETFAPTSIQYDARIFSFRERDWSVSLTLLHGRERLSLRLGNYQRGKLKGQQPKAAQLCKHRNGMFAVHIQLHIPIETPPIPNKAMGVDLGRRDIAHTSTDQSWAVRTSRTSVIAMYGCGVVSNRKPRKAPGVRGDAAASFWHGCRGVKSGSNGR
jgi:putative transposase